MGDRSADIYTSAHNPSRDSWPARKQRLQQLAVEWLGQAIFHVLKTLRVGSSYYVCCLAKVG